jgi:diaminopimelate epimerase
MELVFTKMQGTGNDFVVVDSRDVDLSRHFDMAELARMLCNRRFGIGSDQLLLLCRSSEADFKMLIFNADGSEVEMCGNGIRCLAKYIWDRQISTKDILKIETLSGVKRPERIGNQVRVDMGEPELAADKIPVALKSDTPIIDYPLKVDDQLFKTTCVSMGNPHAVIFIDEDVNNVPVTVYGPAIEHHSIFPDKTNVEFVNVLNKKEMKMRVWERGAGETMACGTGASASAVAAMLKGLTERKVTIHLLGGDLNIEWPKDERVYMTGPAVEVFEGRISNLSGKRIERRRYQRKTCQIQFDFYKKTESRDKVYKCTCIDISESGACVITGIDLKPGVIVSFLKKDGQSVLKNAVVIWSVNFEDKCKAGLMFI